MGIRPSRRATAVLRVIALVLAVAAALAAFLLGDDDPDAKSTDPQPRAQAESAGSTLAPHPGCTRNVTGPFVPTRIAIDGVTTGAPVVATPRDANNVPGVPPRSSEGKDEFAWDEPPGLSPGSAHGNVLLNAHTWPDGSALGNQLLAGLDEGDRVVVRGTGGRQLCYRITERIEVPASPGFPRYYEDIGAPQVAIVVCSGQRLGPGEWTHRTIWFGTPIKST